MCISILKCQRRASAGIAWLGHNEEFFISWFFPFKFSKINIVVLWCLFVSFKVYNLVTWNPAFPPITLDLTKGTHALPSLTTIFPLHIIYSFHLHYNPFFLYYCYHIYCFFNYSLSLPLLIACLLHFHYHFVSSYKLIIDVHTKITHLPYYMGHQLLYFLFL